MQDNTKETLFNASSSSDSSISSEKDDGDKAGDVFKIPPSVDSVNACNHVSEEPHGVVHGNAGGGIREEHLVFNNGWKQRLTQAAMKSVRVKEEPIIP
eukprot:5769570-Ditylum_brightwellii.AAC.1